MESVIFCPKYNKCCAGKPLWIRLDIPRRAEILFLIAFFLHHRMTNCAFPTTTKLRKSLLLYDTVVQLTHFTIYTVNVRMEENINLSL